MEVNVNQNEWNSLSSEDKQKIQSIISSHFPEVKIFGSESSPRSEQSVAALTYTFNFSNPFCTAACGVAEAAAVAACSALSGGVAIAVCVAAAHEAGNYCRSRC